MNPYNQTKSLKSSKYPAHVYYLFKIKFKRFKSKTNCPQKVRHNLGAVLLI